jgi:hypothetical protein
MIVATESRVAIVIVVAKRKDGIGRVIDGRIWRIVGNDFKNAVVDSLLSTGIIENGVELTHVFVQPIDDVIVLIQRVGRVDLAEFFDERFIDVGQERNGERIARERIVLGTAVGQLDFKLKFVRIEVPGQHVLKCYGFPRVH